HAIVTRDGAAPGNQQFSMRALKRGRRRSASQSSVAWSFRNARGAAPIFGLLIPERIRYASRWCDKQLLRAMRSCWQRFAIKAASAENACSTAAGHASIQASPAAPRGRHTRPLFTVRHGAVRHPLSSAEADHIKCQGGNTAPHPPAIILENG